MADEQILGDESGGGAEGQETANSILNGETNEGEEEHKSASGEKNPEDKDESNSEGEGDTDKKSADGEADEDKGGAPESYQDFQAPEGTEIDTELLGEFTPIAKELDLSQDQAQKFIDFMPKVQERIITGLTKDWETKQGDWVKSAKDDPEYGGSQFKASVATANRAIKELGGDKLVKALNETGAGNHPEIIRGFVKIGKLMEEDSISFGKGGEKKVLTQAERLFPSMGTKT